jgi:hypothetical protein
MRHCAKDIEQTNFAKHVGFVRTIAPARPPKNPRAVPLKATDVVRRPVAIRSHAGFGGDYLSDRCMR